MRAIASLLVVLTAVASTAVAILPTSSLAEAWPQRNVRIITPFPAGTGADISARLFAERLALRWEKPVIVENKPGADGILAVTAVVGARDGHTLLYTNGGPVTANPFTHDKLPYDAARDLSPISSAADVANRYLSTFFAEFGHDCRIHRFRPLAAGRAQLERHNRCARLLHSGLLQGMQV